MSIGIINFGDKRIFLDLETSDGPKMVDVERIIVWGSSRDDTIIRIDPDYELVVLCSMEEITSAMKMAYGARTKTYAPMS